MDSKRTTASLAAAIFALAAFGASAGDETALWQGRIDAAHAAGGGAVSLPAGRHEVGQLDLKSGVELRLEKGAVIDATTVRSAYPSFTLPFSEGDWMAVVLATNAHDVAITGEGEIRGNGRAWVDLVAKATYSEGFRPRGLLFSDCRNVRLSGFKLVDAACWGIVLKRCDGVVARHVTVDSHCSSNNDGFDIEAKNALFEDCDIDSGDDGIVLKSNDPGFTVENVVVRRCVSRSTCNALKLGTASHGTMRNILFEDCKTELCRRSMTNPRTGLEWFARFRKTWQNSSDNLAGLSALAIECVDGGVVEDVTVRRCTLDGACVPIFIRGGERYGRKCGIPANDKWILRNILIEKVTGRAESSVASSITGAGRCRPAGITLRDVRLVCKGAGNDYKPTPVPEAAGDYPESNMFRQMLPAWGLYARHVDGLKLEKSAFELHGEDSRERLVTEDAAFFEGGCSVHDSRKFGTISPVNKFVQCNE